MPRAPDRPAHFFLIVLMKNNKERDHVKVLQSPAVPALLIHAVANATAWMSGADVFSMVFD